MGTIKNWGKIDSSVKIEMLGKNTNFGNRISDFLIKFSDKIGNILFAKISIFTQTSDFWRKTRSLLKFTDFRPRFEFLTKFGQNFDFSKTIHLFNDIECILPMANQNFIGYK